MVFDINSISPVTPKEAQVIEGIEKPLIAIDSSAPISPPQVGVTLGLDPLAGAGVLLTKIVLVIVSSVLLLFLIALIVQEREFSQHTAHAFGNEMASIAATTQSNNQQAYFANTLTQMRAVKNLSKPEARTLLISTAENLQKLKESMTNTEGFGKLTEDMRALAKSTQPDTEFDAKFDKLTTQAEDLFKTSIYLGESAVQMKARQDLLKVYLEATNASREFWARIAQMILLNLLLPVLTALLGYVFGSKQGGK